MNPRNRGNKARNGKAYVKVLVGNAGKVENGGSNNSVGDVVGKDERARPHGIVDAGRLSAELPEPVAAEPHLAIIKLLLRRAQIANTNTGIIAALRRDGERTQRHAGNHGCGTHV